MWSSGRRLLHDALAASVRSLSLTPAQNTVVVERWWKVPLSRIGNPPRLHPRRHRIYKVVEDTKRSPSGKLELILTQTVPQFGGRGDTVFVKKSIGRNKLLPQGLAVYASPENKQMFEEELRLLREGRPEDRIQTRTGQLTIDFLQGTKLKINKMPAEEFQLTKEVVSRQFCKMLGVVVPPHALTLPFEPIKEVGEYWCDVTVNGINTVRVPMSLMPYEDPSAAHQREVKRKRKEEAARIAAAAEEDEALVEAVSDAAVEAEAGEHSVSQVSDDSASAGASTAQDTTSDTQTAQDTTAPPSDSPKKD